MDLIRFDERLRAIETQLARLEKQPDAGRLLESKERTLALFPVDTSLDEPKKLVVHQSNLLGYVAVLCFVLAAGFIIKLSIDTGWFTPEKQIILPLLLGGILIGCGFKLLPLDEAYASLLPAAGIIVLYLTTIAAHRLYYLITFQTALVISTCISGLCIWLYLKIKHDVYSLVATAGAYLSPVLLDLSRNAEFSMFYLLLSSCTFAIISIRAQSRTLTVISAYLVIFISGLAGFELHLDKFMAVVLALYFLVFAMGTYFYSQQVKKSLTEYEAWALFPVLVIFYAMEYFYLDRVSPVIAPWASIGFALFTIAQYFSAKKWSPNRIIISKSLTVAFATLVFFHSVYMVLLPNEVRPWIFVALLVGFALLPCRYTTIRTGPFFQIPLLAVYLIILIEYTSMIYFLLEGFNYAWFAASVAGFMSIWLVIIVRRDLFAQKNEQRFLLLAAAHLLAIVILYQVAGGSLAVSASWLFYAVGVISYSFFLKDRVMANSALLVLGVAAGKALLYDAASAPTIVRILCLLLTGMVLYVCGFLIKKIATWSA